ncbi:hypothetical protein TRIP_B50518 [uncultured Desulfatiglans sp.]|nr:hypothetical protein TRIP_B50518 [uncultured Desulfatiglans sp.]
MTHLGLTAYPNGHVRVNHPAFLARPKGPGVGTDKPFGPIHPRSHRHPGHHTDAEVSPCCALRFSGP